jgi:hypothetical protein
MMALESTNAAAHPIACTTKAWEVAFNRLYDGVASYLSKPTGKNRLPKFKYKTIEVWQAMEQAVKKGKQTDAHPIYAMGLKQLEIHRSLHANGPPKRGRPKKSPVPFAGQWDAGVEGAVLMQDNQAYFPTFGASGRVQYVPLSTFAQENSAAADRSGLSSGAAGDAPPAAGAPSTADGPRSASTAPSNALRIPRGQVLTAIPKDFFELWQRGMGRLERILSSQQPPKLPSPLQELYVLKTRAEDPAEIALLEPYFKDALRDHLRLISQQAEMSSHAAMLPGILEGLDQLRQLDNEPTIDASIQYTYRTVLDKYLKLINPTMTPPTIVTSGPRESATPNTTPGTTTTRKRGKSSAANAANGGAGGNRRESDKRARAEAAAKNDTAVAAPTTLDEGRGATENTDSTAGGDRQSSALYQLAGSATEASEHGCEVNEV